MTTQLRRLRLLLVQVSSVIQVNVTAQLNEVRIHVGSGEQRCSGKWDCAGEGTRAHVGSGEEWGSGECDCAAEGTRTHMGSGEPRGLAADRSFYFRCCYPDERRGM